MPLLGNLTSAHPMSPATQVGVIDATSTLGGAAALSTSRRGAVTFTTDADTVTLQDMLLTGNSVVTINGASSSASGLESDITITVRGQASGLSAQNFDRFTWHIGETSMNETYRITGEFVHVRAAATANVETDFSLRIFVMSV